MHGIASMRPRLIAVDDIIPSKKPFEGIDASMRPRLIAVDDVGATLLLGYVAIASMRPRLIAVDDRRGPRWRR